jgi:hypothetical protein
VPATMGRQIGATPGIGVEERSLTFIPLSINTGSECSTIFEFH